jgi:hypothetical protein
VEKIPVARVLRAMTCIAAVLLAIAGFCLALWSRGFVNEGRASDQHDAYSIAARLSCADRDGSFSALPISELTAPKRFVAQVGSRIPGVEEGQTPQIDQADSIFLNRNSLTKP